MSYQSKPPSTYAASKQSSKPGKSMFTRALSLLPGSSSRSKASSPASTQRAPKVTPSRPPLSYRSGATPPTGATHTICHNCPAVNSQKTTVLSRTRRSRGSFISGAADETIVQCANCKTANSPFSGWSPIGRYNRLSHIPIIHVTSRGANLPIKARRIGGRKESPRHRVAHLSPLIIPRLIFPFRRRHSPVSQILYMYLCMIRLSWLYRSGHGLYL